MQYDFIIVGAGSAGCVLTRRLVEQQFSVLLLEAGPKDSHPWIHVPIGYGKTMFDYRVNWGYTTESDPGINSRRMYWPRGKVLGGSSSINGLIYVRGQPEDYNAWARAGCTGWAYHDVLPYFRKAENHIRGADAYHGVSGPLTVSDIGESHPLCDAFIESGQAVGIPRNDDFNGASQEGIGYFQLTTRNGYRCSTARAYLKPVQGRTNLTIATGAQCLNVELENGRVTGVRYRQRDTIYTARAAREVIVAAGAINTPQILELSGIGPKAKLSEHCITLVRQSDAVGENLRDHLQTRLIYRCTDRITTNDDLNNPLRKLRIGLRYITSRSGPLAVGINQAGGFMHSRPDVARPDIQFHFGTLSSDSPGSPVHRFPGFTLSACQLHPRSTGSVHIQSPDPERYPAIHPNYLSNDHDIDVLVDGLKLARRLAITEPLSRYIVEEYAPGPHHMSDDSLRDFIRDDATTIFHPCGTCRMGSDQDSVVDPELRVRGVPGLRLADASIMPDIPSGNTNAPVVMIGEKAADLILDAHLAKATSRVA
ncbi:choline dehydrogenase [Salinisphaera sp. USBA-960]|uniref:GMC family oxidoreductase n=1 Tax=Salinisphaera orenii TaxID=856731 RepID=UPI000DBE9B65|nr:choline dehydrogenase [Salifodinibacter halophilus]NNC26029.1 choline dehydrogenase [Salifodinibacter halophilus]